MIMKSSSWSIVALVSVIVGSLFQSWYIDRINDRLDTLEYCFMTPFDRVDKVRCKVT
jgi:hypothetical protein